MDATRVHLFITHLPVFGLFLGFLALAYGLIRNDRQVKIVSLSIVLIATIGAFIAFQTGEGAEETAEHIAGVSEDAIHEHEESAEFAILFFYGVGILSLVALYLEAKVRRYARELSIAVLALSAVTFFIVARTASLGGKVRHTEIVDGNGTSPGARSDDER